MFKVHKHQLPMELGKNMTDYPDRWGFTRQKNGVANGELVHSLCSENLYCVKRRKETCSYICIDFFRQRHILNTKSLRGWFPAAVGRRDCLACGGPPGARSCVAAAAGACAKGRSEALEGEEE